MHGGSLKQKGNKNMVVYHKFTALNSKVVKIYVMTNARL